MLTRSIGLNGFARKRASGATRPDPGCTRPEMMTMARSGRISRAMLASAKPSIWPGISTSVTTALMSSRVRRTVRP